MGEKDDVKIKWNVSFVKKYQEKPSEDANINMDIQAGVQGQGVDQKEGSTGEQKFRIELLARFQSSRQLPQVQLC